MAHLSKRLLAIAVLVVLAAVTSVEAITARVEKAENAENVPTENEHSPTWCVAKKGTDPSVLAQTITKLCSPKGSVDCSPIQPHGHCFYPNNILHHASFAMDHYYKMHGECRFGYSEIVKEFPQDQGGCFHHVDDDKFDGGHEGEQEGGQEGGEESHDENQHDDQHNSKAEPEEL